MRRGRFAVLALLLSLPACASVVPGFQEVAQPAAPPDAGRVVLFTGLNWSGESHRATGTDALAQQIRRAGVPADVFRPGEWDRAATQLLALRPPPAAIAVYGYSAGGPAAARFLERVAGAGLRAETLLVLESWRDATVPCGVGLALQYRLEDGGLLRAARPGCAEVHNELIHPDVASRGGGLGHLSVAADAMVMRMLLGELVRDGRVRRR